MTVLSDIIACPRCGGADVVSGGGANDVIECLCCNSRAVIRDNVVIWECEPLNTSVSVAKFLSKAGRAIFNPLVSPLLPFRYLMNYKVERYYHRTLRDRELASRWKDHYLEGIETGNDFCVLDFGCGRGRNVGILGQLEFNVVGQDISINQWWGRLKKHGFQCVNGYKRLPWQDNSFDLILQVGVIHYLDAVQLSDYLDEARRIVKPGGYIVMLEANNNSYGAHSFKKQIGNMYTIENIAGLLEYRGVSTISLSYEAYYAPVFPLFCNFIRKILFSKSPDIMSDYDSSTVERTPPDRRGLWLLKLRAGSNA